MATDAEPGEGVLVGTWGAPSARPPGYHGGPTPPDRRTCSAPAQPRLERRSRGCAGAEQVRRSGGVAAVVPGGLALGACQVDEHALLPLGVVAGEHRVVDLVNRPSGRA